MKKNEVIQKLKKGNFSNGVAEIICDVFSSQGTSHKNQSILVILDKYGYECVNDQINEIKHWFIFNSLNEFVERTQMMGNIEYPKISKPVSKIAVGKFLSIRDFISDFVPKDRNGKEIHVGDKVRWYDPENKSCDLERIYTISKIGGYENDDIILICDRYSEVETCGYEIELIKE